MRRVQVTEVKPVIEDIAVVVPPLPILGEKALVTLAEPPYTEYHGRVIKVDEKNRTFSIEVENA